MNHKRRGTLTIEKQKVAILGATGLIGRWLAESLMNHPWFEIGMLVGSDASIGRLYREVWQEKEDALQQYYDLHNWHVHIFPEQLDKLFVASFEDLLSSDIALVFSAIPQRVGMREQRLLETGRTVFSNSPYGRFEPYNPLVIAEVNHHILRDQQFIKNPNCVTSGLVIALDSLQQHYGLDEVSVTTFQSLSGRGDAKYALDLVQDNIYPLHQSAENTEIYIAQEVKKILNTPFSLSICCNRAYVQEGHYVDVRIKTKQPIPSRETVIGLFEHYNPLAQEYLPSSPEHPIIVTQETGRPRPRQDAWHHNGMAIAIGNISTEDEIYDLRFSYVVNNLMRGAAGGAILNAEAYLNKAGKQVQLRHEQAKIQ